jgi:hypothetical protein
MNSENYESNFDSSENDICHFKMRTCVPKGPNAINDIFSTHMQISNGNQLYLQQETRPYVSGFPLGCSDHITVCVTLITGA